jgi:hypothetical protein
MLRALAFEKPKLWNKYLQQCVFAYNTTPHRATCASPFFLVHGEEARLPVELLYGTPAEVQPVTHFVRKLLRRIQLANDTARQASNRAQNIAKDYYDANVDTRLYKTGDVVYVLIYHHKPGTSIKLAPRWSGPAVVQKVDGVLVQVLEPDGNLRFVHQNKLSAKIPPGGPPFVRQKRKPKKRKQARRAKRTRAESTSSSSEHSSSSGNESEDFDIPIVYRLRPRNPSERNYEDVPSEYETADEALVAQPPRQTQGADEEQSTTSRTIVTEQRNIEDAFEPRLFDEPSTTVHTPAQVGGAPQVVTMVSEQDQMIEPDKMQQSLTEPAHNEQSTSTARPTVVRKSDRVKKPTERYGFTS